MNTINMQQGVNSEGSPRETVSAKGERLPGFRIDSKDVLQQLQANIALLEDKCGRLNFMLNEVRSVIRK